MSDGRPLAEVLDDLGTRFTPFQNVQLEVHWDDLVAAGVERETPVTVRVEGAVLGSVLRAIAKEVGDERFGYEAISPSRVVVTTPGGLVARHGVIREYDLSDVVQNADGDVNDESVAEFANLVAESVDPDSWAGAPQPADSLPAPEPTTAYMRWSGPRLTVRQSRENHRAIDRLLEQVWEMGDPLGAVVHARAVKD